jgi:HD-GYP domain-containing protein (c-di-GMP phosphodiesterase class II)/DNA-binding CsgD family transcriptional regulator
VFRLLGLLGGLSVATDLGTGAPMEEALRRCVVGVRLARALGEPDEVVDDVLWTSLLQHLGCSAWSHEAAATWGDDVRTTRLAFLTDFDRPRDVWGTWVTGLAEVTGAGRARALVATVQHAKRSDAEGPPATCEVARDAARMLGLPAGVQRALHHGLASWDGSGHPGARGEEIPRATRIMHVASTAVMFALDADRTTAIERVRRRDGRLLDPTLVAAFLDVADEVLLDLEEMDPQHEVLGLEPDPVRWVDTAQLEHVAATLGALADLKSPWLQGHSSGVARLVADAAAGGGVAEQATRLGVAGHLHDLGRVAVSSRIWDKVGPLTAAEQDQVHLHPFYSESIVGRVPELHDVAVLVGQHHERCDGGGYHRGMPAAGLSYGSRLLAAADAYRSLVEPGPRRPAVGPHEAAHELDRTAKEGQLDVDAVRAVLAAAGHDVGPDDGGGGPAGLTPRQVQVLRLVASGLSNPEIADRLGISRRTAEHHVQAVYERAGVSTRAGAALFAMHHGLLDPAG